MKRVFALLLCVMLVVACFSGCGKSEFFGDKKQIYYQSYGEYNGTFGGTVYVHNLGNLNKLPVGKYDVIEVIVTRGKVQYINPKEITIRVSETDYGGYEKKGFIYDSELNENPPENLKKLIEEYIRTH